MALLRTGRRHRSKTGVSTRLRKIDRRLSRNVPLHHSRTGGSTRLRKIDRHLSRNAPRRHSKIGVSIRLRSARTLNLRSAPRLLRTARSSSLGTIMIGRRQDRRKPIVRTITIRIKRKTKKTRSTTSVKT